MQRAGRKRNVQSAVTFIVVYDAWRLHPLVWIHRGEARRIARELRRAGQAVRCRAFGRSIVADPGAGRRILRLSDPVMFLAAEALSAARVPYIGPGFEVMKRCYDRYAASRLVAAGGFTCPETVLGTEADRIEFPVVLKPRWGSDSIGLRLYTHGPVHARKRNERYIVQRYIRGADITVGVLNGEAGAPLHIRIPDDALYTFVRVRAAAAHRAGGGTAARGTGACRGVADCRSTRC